MFITNLAELISSIYCIELSYFLLGLTIISVFLILHCFGPKKPKTDKIALNYAEQFEQQNDYAMAIKFYRIAGQIEKVAALYEKEESYAHAAATYRALGDMGKAIDCYKNAGDYYAVAKLYEGSYEWLEAAEYYKQSGHLLKAACNYEKGNRIELAINCYSTLGNHLEIGRLYIRDGNLKGAARTFEELYHKLDEKSGENNYQIEKQKRLVMKRCIDLNKKLERHAKVAYFQGVKENIEQENLGFVLADDLQKALGAYMKLENAVEMYDEEKDTSFHIAEEDTSFHVAKSNVDNSGGDLSLAGDVYKALGAYMEV